MAIPQAKKALQLLNGENPQNRNIPFVLLTNGGGMTEAEKAEQISNLVDIKINPDQVILSHSPMRTLTEQYQDKRVLIVGGKEDICAKVAKGYGFKKVVTPNDIHAWKNSVWPYSKKSSYLTEAAQLDFSKTPIEAVMVFHDSYDWGRDIQVILDAVCCQDGIIGTVKPDFSTQTMPLYFSNNDLIWSNDFTAARLGQGAFKQATEKLYSAVTEGSKLTSTSFGKPHAATYTYAEKTILDQFRKLYQLDRLTLPKQKVYAVGDNPHADVKGANGYGWKSILVKTGVFRGEGNSKEYPADVVCDHVLDAVQWAIQQEENEDAGH
ncbi:unnamed protein product [Cunninghamella echinulata]